MEHQIDELKEKYRSIEEVGDYLDKVKEDVVDHAGQIVGSGQDQQQGQGNPMQQMMQAQARESLRRYHVNLLVDNAFLGFGYVNTGYAFAPEVTNLQMLRLGGRLKPLPETDGFEDLEVGTDFFAYWRQKEGAPVSDFRANVQDRDLGHEVDIYANWKVFSDLSVMLRYGRFWTGDAFADEEARDYMYAGMIYSF